MSVPAARRLLVDEFLARHPLDAARELDATSVSATVQLLAPTPAVAAAEVIARLNPDHAARVIVELEEPLARGVMESLDPVQAANLVARLSQEDRERLLALVGAERRREIDEIQAYPPGTAGHLMDARVTAFALDTTVEAAWERLRGLRRRRITDVVLVDDERRFAGVVRLQDIVTAEPGEKLGALMDPRAVQIHPMATREDVVERLNRYRLASMAVVDMERRVVGVIRHDALVEAAQEDAAADMQQMVGASTEERALSTPWFGVRSRLPWLNINLLTAFLASAVVGLFEGTLARFTAVAILLPVVAGQSGNTGAQALAVTMRGLALREIRAAHAFRVLRKELLLGLVNGISIGLVTSGGVYLWSHNRGLALVMFIAMVLSMTAASVSGAAIPIVLTRLGRDPATASSIVLTTITDVVGFSTFLGLATMLAYLLQPG